MLAALTVVVALGAFVGVGAAHTGVGAGAESIRIVNEFQWLPMIGEEYCDTEGGGLLQSGIGFTGLLFIAGVIAAIFIAALLEAFPLTGWLNNVAFMMMGKIPIAIGFVFLSITFLTVALGTYGITAPPCVPIVGGG